MKQPLGLVVFLTVIDTPLLALGAGRGGSPAVANMSRHLDMHRHRSISATLRMKKSGWSAQARQAASCRPLPVDGVFPAAHVDESTLMSAELID
ncbi:MAG: hypothetical protein M3256_11130 [Actinomycetota bacterium]|nr:hypothetical protein [Actinomycetota bacterium]